MKAEKLIPPFGILPVGAVRVPSRETGVWVPGGCGAVNPWRDVSPWAWGMAARMPTALPVEEKHRGEVLALVPRGRRGGPPERPPSPSLPPASRAAALVIVASSRPRKRRGVGPMPRVCMVACHGPRPAESGCGRPLWGQVACHDASLATPFRVSRFSHSRTPRR